MKLKEVMRRFPMTVDHDSDLGLASQMMLWAGVRHLPVTEGGKLVGVLTQRDVLAHQAAAREDWRQTPVREAMRPAETAGPDDSVSEAAGRMAEHRIGCLPVTDKGALVGLVTTTDILSAQLRQAMQPPTPEGGPRVGEAMTRDPAAVHPDDHLLDAAARMQALRVRHLPVVDGEDRVLGMLSDRDVRATVGDPSLAFAEGGETQVRAESLRVADAMTRDPITIGPATRCAEVATYFADHRLGAVPVSDDSGRLVGILSYVDLLRAMAARG